MSKKYTSKEVKIIDELIDHIQQNVGMYIGESETPLHLFEECFTNSIDEALAGYSNIIAIKIDENNVYHIIDNGRGIPIQNDVPIKISTKFAGAKFQGSKTVYDIVAGKHGIGLVVVNALSLWYQIEIYRDNTYAKFEFEKGKLINQNIEEFNEKVPFSSKVSFKPDPQFFNKEQILVDDIKNRALIASIEIPECTLVVENDSKNVISKDKLNYFKEYCLNSDSETTDIIHLKSTEKNEKLESIFCWSKDGATSQKILSSVNVLPIIDGGVHVNIFNKIIRDVLTNRGRKLNYRFQPSDIQIRLRGYISCNLLYPEFGAQSKDKLTNRKDYFDKLSSKFKNQFENYLNKNPEVLEDLLKHFQSYRRGLESKKIRNRTTKRASVKLTKLQDCKSRHGELFIVEGDSACFTGDVEILDINLDSISFSYLYTNFNKSTYYTFSCEESGIIYVTRITNCFITKYVNELIKIVLDNNEVITCTIDHNYMLIDGTYKEAQFLEENDNLMSLPYDTLNGLKAENNHKVKSIEVINVNNIPVYDIVVDSKDHNFPLKSGIFVHNSGTITEARDPNIHAVLPLKGKVPSVINKKEDIVKNHEISELITALGTGYGPEFNIDKLRYDKVISLVDADPDGSHIASLLTIAIAILVPDIIKQGNYYIARTPLRAINDPKKKKFIPLWTEEDYDKAIEEKHPITYFKGLGELNGEQLEKCALDSNNRKLIQISFSNNLKKVMSLFSDVNKKRELLEDENIKLLK